MCETARHSGKVVHLRGGKAKPKRQGLEKSVGALLVLALISLDPFATTREN
jgi:hypothetical protein